MAALMVPEPDITKTRQDEKRMRRAAAAVKGFMGVNPQTPGLAALENDLDSNKYLIERSEDSLGVTPCKR